MVWIKQTGVSLRSISIEFQCFLAVVKVKRKLEQQTDFQSLIVNQKKSWRLSLVWFVVEIIFLVFPWTTSTGLLLYLTGIVCDLSARVLRLTAHPRIIWDSLWDQYGGSCFCVMHVLHTVPTQSVLCELISSWVVCWTKETPYPTVILFSVSLISSWWIYELGLQKIPR
jgi:hypothetical protein